MPKLKVFSESDHFMLLLESSANKLNCNIKSFFNAKKMYLSPYEYHDHSVILVLAKEGPKYLYPFPLP